MGKTSAIGMAIAALAWLAGCAHGNKALPPVKDEPYRVGREDVLEVAVWRDGDLSRVLPVRPDGFISLPMIGDVKADGLTTSELADEIRQKLTPFIQEPRVTVMVPGSYPLRGRISVLQAVALAGGFSDFANQDGIIVIRNGARYPVRYSELMSEPGDRPMEAVLMPGDTVVVP